MAAYFQDEKGCFWAYDTGNWSPWTITIDTASVACNDNATIALYVYRDEEVAYERTVEAPRSQSQKVARQLALEGILFVVGQLLGENQWVQAFMLLWEAVKVAMILGRWVSASQGADGKQLARGLLDLVMEGVG